jgi:tetratricopeptide (TPR) repeat protein
MAKYPTLSVCMIVKNEEKNLPRLLDSIKGLADEVIVVDTGSTDSTVEVAENFGATVYHFEWCDDFAAARNESLKYATMDYILWLDGDDEVMQDDHQKIKRHLMERKGTAVYLNIRLLQPGRMTQAAQLRAFPNHKGITFRGRIHEQVYFSVTEMGLPVSRCDATIVHHGYADSLSSMKKLDRNRVLEERQLKEFPDDFYTLFFLGRTYKGLYENQKALDCLRKVADLGRGDKSIRNQDIFKAAILDMASILSDQGKIEDAIATLDDWRTACGDTPLAGFSLGELYFRKGDFKTALKELLPIKDQDFDGGVMPVDSQGIKHSLLHYTGVSSLHERSFETAVDSFKGLIALDPDRSENYNYLSLAFEKMGNLEEATAVCRQGLSIFPEDELLRKRLFRLLVTGGDLESALEEYNILGGYRTDIDLLAALFMIHCMRLDPGGMNASYHSIQQELSLPVQDFPEAMDKVKESLSLSNETEAAAYFNRAVSHLLQINI